MTKHKTDMNITKIKKHNKKTVQQFHNEDKNKQVHLQIKIHSEHLKNITKIGKYKKTELPRIKE